MAASTMSPGEGQKRLLQQIERGQELLQGSRISPGDFNAWSTATEDLLARIYGTGSVVLRGFKSDIVRPTAQEMKDSSYERPHRGTLQNRVTLLESLVESLRHDEAAQEEEPARTEESVLEDPKRIILTWSGKTSHTIALFLHGWLKAVIPSVTPWISSEDIAKGDRWFPELMRQLGKSTRCLVCVTPENHKAPWVYYEAGVISGKQERGKIYTVLFGVTVKSIKDTPLEQFQATEAVKDDFWRLVKTINNQLPEGSLDDTELGRRYESNWPGLETTIGNSLQVAAVPTETGETIDLVSEYGLSDEAKELLRESCQDSGGCILYNDALGGARIYTNGRNFLDPYTPRARALWLGAIRELIDAGFVEEQGDGVFRLTREGYKVGDGL